jgi:hypothetical protein
MEGEWMEKGEFVDYGSRDETQRTV